MNEMETFLLVTGILFTIGIIATLTIISRQVIRSKWIDSRGPKVLFVFLFLVIGALTLAWISLLFYLGIL